MFTSLTTLFPFLPLISLFTLLTSLRTTTALDAWHLDEIAILVNEQLDPIISPNQQASHMHKVIGGSGFAGFYNYGVYSKAKCTSLKLGVDKSNYWMPNLYAKSPTTGKFTSIPALARFYYFLGRNSPSEPVKPFPEGLRILAGDPTAKTKTAQAIFSCQINPDFTNNIEGDTFNFNRTCEYGMKTDLFFPPCWNGIDLWKSDGSHMAYTNYINAGPCPVSHPVRLPSIMLEYTWLTSQVLPGIPLAGNLVWANGDSTGYGIHGDFIDGWDTSLLSKALVSPGCAIGTDNAIPIVECDVFKPYFQSSQAMSDCRPDAGILAEPTGNDDQIALDTLPGCNPIWASGSKPTCSTPPPQLDMRGLTGTDGPLVASSSQRVNSTTPTGPGWQEINCISDSRNILGGVSYNDNTLTPSSCQASCFKGGYTYAGVGQIGSSTNWNCVCGTSISANAGVTPGQCDLPCPGDSTQTCGNNYIFKIYQAGPGTTLSLPSTNDNSTILGCYNLPQSGGLTSSTTYTFMSGSMTRELCLTSCRQYGSSWAYTKGPETCACGSDFTPSPGTFIPDRYCTINCNGNSSQKCGDWYQAIVYNISTSTIASSPSAKPEGLLGCYSSSSFVASNGFTYNSDTTSPTLCRRSCRARGYAYAGLGGGNTCYCSSTPPTSSDVVPSAVCNIACNGESKITCGGERSVSIYETTGSGAQVPSGYPESYVGCSYDGNPRTLGGYVIDSNNLTSRQCRDVCSSRGYKVYGTQYGTQCFCGDGLGPRGLIPDEMCNVPCSGNSTEMCGQAYVLSMYSLSQVGSTSNSTVPVSSSADNNTSTTISSTQTNGNNAAAVVTPSSATTTTTPRTSTTSITSTMTTTSIIKNNTSSSITPSSSTTSLGKTTSPSSTASSATTSMSKATISSTTTSSTTTPIVKSSTSSTTSLTTSLTTRSNSSSTSTLKSTTSSSSSSTTTTTSTVLATTRNTTSSSTSTSTAKSASLSTAKSGTSTTGTSTQATTVAKSSSTTTSSTLSSSSSKGSATTSSSISASSMTTLSSTTSARPTTTSTTPTSSLSTTPTSLPGCFSSTTRTIASSLITSPSLTIDTCRAWCSFSGFAYSLITEGSTCGCKATLGDLTRVSDNKCGMACSGGGSGCGGANGSNVWMIYTAMGRGAGCSRGLPKRFGID